MYPLGSLFAFGGSFWEIDVVNNWFRRYGLPWCPHCVLNECSSVSCELRYLRQEVASLRVRISVVPTHHAPLDLQLKHALVYGN